MTCLKYAFALALLASPALAADLPQAEPEPTLANIALPFSWTGAYAGIQGGYSWADSKYKVPLSGASVKIDPDGVFGGVHAGYNYQLPQNIVLGIEGEFNYSDIGKSGASTDDSPGDNFFGRVKWTAGAEAKAGYAFGRFLPFVTGGVGVARYKHGADIDFGDGTLSASKTYVGWTVGAGVDFAFTDHLFATVEYRHSDFGKKTFGEQQGYFEHKVDLDTDDVRLGLSYKF